ncbi:hypothetical protein D3C87_1612740 [compost metagenome]
MSPFPRQDLERVLLVGGDLDRLDLLLHGRVIAIAQLVAGLVALFPGLDQGNVRVGAERQQLLFSGPDELHAP